MNRRALIIVLVAIIAISLISIYISGTLLRPPVEKKKVVVYAYNDAITGIDPSIEDDTGLVILGIVYEPLLYYDPLRNEFKPALAVNWTANEDHTEWTFYLRRDVVFHDGTKFNATAVKISIERAKKLYEETGRGLGYIWEHLEEIEIIDEYTVKFKLSVPQRLDLIASASYSAYIFSPAVLERSGASSYLDEKLIQWFNEGNAAGTGPYMLEKYSPDSEVVLRKFDKWWGWSIVNNDKAPDVVVIRILTDPQAQYNGLIDGSVHITSSVPRASISDLLAKGFKCVNLTTYHNYLLFFNVKRYPTNITEFRKAVLHAFDLREAVNIAMYGYALVGSGVIPHYFPGFVEGLRYEYNVTAARELLKASGVQTPVTIKILYQVDYEENRRFVNYLKSRLQEIGIVLEEEAVTWDQLKDIAKGVWTEPEKTPHIIIADWWPTIPSPMDYLYTMFHSESKEWNFAGYENPEFDELLYKAFEMEGTNYTEAMRLYEIAQRMIFEEAIGINLWDEVKCFMYSPKLEVPPEALNPLYMYVIRFELVRVEG